LQAANLMRGRKPIRAIILKHCRVASCFQHITLHLACVSIGFALCAGYLVRNYENSKILNMRY